MTAKLVSTSLSSGASRSQAIRGTFARLRCSASVFDRGNRQIVETLGYAWVRRTQCLLSNDECPLKSTFGLGIASLLVEDDPEVVQTDCNVRVSFDPDAFPKSLGPANTKARPLRTAHAFDTLQPDC